MASGYTANYGLCQWQPEDKFLREEFNQDNEKIDAAVAAASSQASKALSGLEGQSYNIYNLILQNDYAGKYTGWKKALLFDGFRNASGVAEKSSAVTMSEGANLSKTGQSTITWGYGSEKNTPLTSKEEVMMGGGTITGFRCKIYSIQYLTTSGRMDYSISVNGQIKVSGETDLLSLEGQSSLEFTQNLPGSIPIAYGDRVTLTLDYGGNDWLPYTDSSGTYLGGSLLLTALSGSTGHLLSVRRELPACAAALAWVRHSAGTVKVALRDSGSQLHSLTADGTRTTQTPEGISCTESAFRLATALEAGSWAVRLDLNLNGSSNMKVYDYGVMLI